MNSQGLLMSPLSKYGGDFFYDKEKTLGSRMTTKSFECSRKSYQPPEEPSTPLNPSPPLNPLLPMECVESKVEEWSLDPLSLG